jgi:hypothetical protein
MATKQMTMGVIVGNRGFFPDHLAKSGRDEILGALKAARGGVHTGSEQILSGGNPR